MPPSITKNISSDPFTHVRNFRSPDPSISNGFRSEGDKSGRVGLDPLKGNETAADWGNDGIIISINEIPLPGIYDN
ncbi:hypothetical protein V2J09_014588 [Rumex salicifolius]